jgi:small-conductance mechanosensitive channel
MFILTAIPIDFSPLLSPENIAAAVRIFVLALIGFPVLFFVSAVVRKTVNKRFTAQAGMLAGKAIFYTGGTFLIVTILYQMGFRLTALLGAAGVVGIAIGFASQTSVSNIISGLFLISEKPFAVGDIINVGDTTGTVLSIDLLSVKLKQFDNCFVRIPNEMLIKTQVTNKTRFPIRRLDINIGVAYKEDVTMVRRVLLDVAMKTPYCLDEPEPEVRFVNFGDSALEFLFVIWCVKEDYLKLQTSIMQMIKERFDADGIEIPFPHRTLYTGSVTDPFPIRLIKDDKK